MMNGFQINNNNFNIMKNMMMGFMNNMNINKMNNMNKVNYQTIQISKNNIFWIFLKNIFRTSIILFINEKFKF